MILKSFTQVLPRAVHTRFPAFWRRQTGLGWGRVLLLLRERTLEHSVLQGFVCSTEKNSCTKGGKTFFAKEANIGSSKGVDTEVARADPVLRSSGRVLVRPLLRRHHWDVLYTFHRQ